MEWGEGEGTMRAEKQVNSQRNVGPDLWLQQNYVRNLNLKWLQAHSRFLVFNLYVVDAEEIWVQTSYGKTVTWAWRV